MGKTNGSNLKAYVSMMIKRYLKKKLRQRGWVRKSEVNSSKNNRLYNQKVPVSGIFYRERKDAGPVNFSEKIEREKQGEHFEWPNMVALNQTIACFIKDARRIVNIGSGTGSFEWFASVDDSISFTASEFDTDCVAWCKQNRQRSNIYYCSKSMETLISENSKFDLAVAVDVIEHIFDYGSFLRNFSLLADRAIITTPNRDRSLATAMALEPDYYQHCREWNAGEFYWVLRTFYKKVELYAMPDVYVPKTVPIGFLSTMTPLIAVCTK